MQMVLMLLHLRTWYCSGCTPLCLRDVFSGWGLRGSVRAIGACPLAPYSCFEDSEGSLCVTFPERSMFPEASKLLSYYLKSVFMQ